MRRAAGTAIALAVLCVGGCGDDTKEEPAGADVTPATTAPDGDEPADGSGGDGGGLDFTCPSEADIEAAVTAIVPFEPIDGPLGEITLETSTTGNDSEERAVCQYGGSQTHFSIDVVLPTDPTTIEAFYFRNDGAPIDGLGERSAFDRTELVVLQGSHVVETQVNDNPDVYLFGRDLTEVELQEINIALFQLAAARL